MHITIDTLSSFESVRDPVWAYGAAWIGSLRFRHIPGVRLEMEGLERLPKQQVIFAQNHTHMLDFLPLRAPLLVDHGINMVSWVKARAFKHPAMGKFLSKTGCPPLCSRGYFIVADFHALIGRRPSEAEYQALRAHTTHGEPLPAGEPFEAIKRVARDMVGWHFNPQCTTYREAIEAAYQEAIAITLRLTRRAMNHGHHVHVYPQGSISSRLTRGHLGLAHAAAALDLPVVPVGVSGCRETFVGSSPSLRPGRIVVRFGDPYRIPIEELPAGFRPFNREDELANYDWMQHHVDEVMARLNTLLEPDYQYSEGFEHDGKSGTARFF